jgi:hypothetical protein
MPLEKRRHVLVACELAAACLFAPFADRRSRFFIKRHWPGLPGRYGQKHFRRLVLIGFG